MRYFKR